MTDGDILAGLIAILAITTPLTAWAVQLKRRSDRLSCEIEEHDAKAR